MGFGEGVQPVPERPVRRDSAGDHEMRRCRTLRQSAADGALGAVDEAIDDRRLGRGREIRDIAGRERPMAMDELLGRTADGGFQSRKAEIAIVRAEKRPWQVEAPWIAGLGRPRERGSARIAEAEELCRLVEGFARRIVDRASKPAIASDALDEQKLTMPAGNQKQQIGEGKVVHEARREGMALEMIDGEKGLSGAIGDGLAGDEPDEKAADQPGTGRCGDGIDLVDPEPCLFERGTDQPVERLDMGTGGDLGHDTAESGMPVRLAQKGVAEYAPRAIDKGGGRLVAARLDPQNDRSVHHVLRTPLTGDPDTLRGRFMQQELVIGTRGSPLALAQARAVQAALLAAHPSLAPDAVRLEVFTTRGDRILDRPLADIGGKGLFTEELEAAMRAGAIQCAVHSTKDMPTALADDLMLAAFLPREDPRDALIAPMAKSLAELPKGAVVGTSSLRREAQLMRLRPDLRIVGLRGNIGTRMAKIEAGAMDAALLAYAGLKRLGFTDRPEITPIAVDIILPAPAQGAIAIECRRDDSHMRALLAPINDDRTALAIMAERAFLAGLAGDCRTPIAALAVHEGGEIVLEGRLLTPDGRLCLVEKGRAAAADAEALGRDLAARIAASPDSGYALRIMGR